MVTRKIEIEDTLSERVNMACDEVRDRVFEILDDMCHAEVGDDLYLSDFDDDGSIHEIVDGCVPIYTHEIESTWFLHGSKIEEAYENMGIGDNPRENYGMTAIFCFIDEAVNEWFDGPALLDEWRQDNTYVLTVDEIRKAIAALDNPPQSETGR